MKQSVFKSVLFAFLGVFIFSNILTSCVFIRNESPKTIPVKMKVDFGPAKKSGFDEMIYIEKGTTPKEAVSQVFPILSGKSCCSLREVIEIGGVRVEPAKNLWWICLVNGSKNISPQKKELKEDDTVEWKYIDDSK